MHGDLILEPAQERHMNTESTEILREGTLEGRDG